MAEILDDVAYLSQEIGPRPAGTEEEQQAALFIADQVHKRTNLEAEIEDISCNANAGLVDIIYFGAAFLALLLSLLLPLLGGIWFLVSLVCTACFLAEEKYHRPVLSRLLSRDASQNVVAKYRPEAAVRSGSRRKIIVVANYDSGKVKSDLKPSMLKAWSVLGHAADIAMIAAPIVLFFRNIVFADALGFVSGFFSFLAVIAAVLVLVPTVRVLIHRGGAYNEAANVNASSVAVLLNLMERASGHASATASDQQDVPNDEEQPVIHGREAAEQAGVVPEGVELQYEDAQPESAEEVAGDTQDAGQATGATEAQDQAVRAAAASESATVSQAESDEPDVVENASDIASSPADVQVTAQEDAVDHPADVQQATSEDELQQETVATTASVVEQEQLPVEEVIEPEPAAAPAGQDNHNEEEGSPAERLRAAKAAIAALTGEPVDNNIYARDIAEEPIDMRPQPIDVPNERGQERMRSDMMSALGGPQATEPRDSNMNDVATQQPLPDTASVAESEAQAQPVFQAAEQPVRTEIPADTVEEEPQVIHNPQVPDWYRSAQEKAKRSDKRVGSVHRSRYADALDSAVKESSIFFKEANQLVDEETESRLQNMRRGISEVRAPRIPDEPVKQQSSSHGAAVQPPDTRRQTIPGDKPVPASVDAVSSTSPQVSHQPGGAVDDNQRAQRQQLANDVPPVERPHDMVASPRPNAEQTQTRPATQMVSAAIPAVDKNAIPEISESEIRSEISGDARRDTKGNKVLEEDPSLGHTVAMKPIHMPVAEDQRAGSGEKPRAAATSRRQPRPVKPRVKLPEVPSANMAPISDTAKQRAPLAQATAIDGQAAAKSLLSHTIPKIDVASLSGDLGEPVKAGDDAPAENKRQNLIEHLPSLSGSVSSDTSAPMGTKDAVVSATGSFTAVSATGTFAPVGDELVADIAPEDRYVDDADDSIDAGGVTESGAVAGPDYVDMPKSRASRFFSHFHRKNKKAENEQSPQEWLDVEDDFDARSIGRERGDWDSFQQGDARAHTADRHDNDYIEDAPYDGYEEYDANDGEVPNGTYAQGVIYESSVTYENPISRPTEEQKAYSDDIIDEQPVDESSEPLNDDRKNSEHWEGGAFSGLRSRVNREGDSEAQVSSRNGVDRNRQHREGEAGNRAPRNGRLRNENEPRQTRRAPARNTMPPLIDDAQIERELQDIYEFADDQVNTEVWFVALGAQEEAGNAGIKNFLAAHANELKGAIVVSIEGMGAGTLGFGNSEGVLKHRAPSTRVKRFLHTASQATGIDLVRSDQTWRESTASVAMADGLQAVSLMGLDGDKPAYYAQSDDVLENIDEEQVRRNANYLWEFLKAF